MEKELTMRHDVDLNNVLFYPTPGSDVSKPSLKALAYALRHRETWPKDFHWDFKHCKTCAMGLADKLWHIVEDRSDTYIYSIAKKFNMKAEDAEAIFYDGEYFRIIWFGIRRLPVYAGNITPEMVADKIDDYLAKAK